MEFLQSSISPVQFGFLKKHSSLQQLMLFYDRIIGSTAQWDVIFLDFAKAFDSVPHNELLLKLKHLGVSGDLWLWLQCYLSRRQQCVCIEGCRSELLPVVSGVPQGSILGPLLFLVFINDLPDSVKNSMLLLFADDAKCAKHVSGPFDCALLQDDLNSLHFWSCKWNLTFKEIKCVLLRCCSKGATTLTTYSLNSKDIQVQDTHKDLGVIISDDLSFSAHYKHVTSRAYRVLGLLRRTFTPTANVKEKRLLYISLVRSQLMYCSELWRPHLVKDIVLLESVQRRATKYILNDFESDYRSRLVKLDLLPLMYVFELKDVMFCVKNLKSPTRGFKLDDYLTFRRSGTRSSTAMKMSHKLSSNNSTRHFYLNRLPRLWNSLPPINLMKSADLIKHQLEVFMYRHFEVHFDSNCSCTYHLLCPCAKCCYSPHPPHF